MDMRHEICIEYSSDWCHNVALLLRIIMDSWALLHVVFTHHLHKTSNNFLQFLNEQQKENRPNKVVNYTWLDDTETVLLQQSASLLRKRKKNRYPAQSGFDNDRKDEMEDGRRRDFPGPARLWRAGINH